MLIWNVTSCGAIRVRKEEHMSILRINKTNTTEPYKGYSCEHI